MAISSVDGSRMSQRINNARIDYHYDDQYHEENELTDENSKLVVRM